MGVFATRTWIVVLLAALVLLPACWRSQQTAAGEADGGTDSDSQSESDVDDPCGDKQADLEWVSAISGSSEVSVQQVALSPDGEILVAGYFGGSASFGAGEPIQIVLDSPADSAAFLGKYDADGTLAWATILTDSEIDNRSLGLAASPTGEIFVVGRFGGQAVFGPGDPGETTIGGSDSASDGFVAKYDEGGEIIWAERIGGPGGHDSVTAVEALPDGSVVIAGEFGSTEAVFGEGQPGENSLNPIGYSDMFIARYLGDGAHDWVQHVGGTGDECGGRVALLGDSLIVTGSFSSETTFDIGGPNETVVPAPEGMPSQGLFVAAYGVDGSFSWVRAPGTGHSQNVEPVGDDRAVLTGVFRESIVFGEGEAGETSLTANGEIYDVFVASYEVDGSIVWARQISAEGNAASSGLAGGLSIFPDGAYVVAGEFASSLVLEPGLEDGCELESAGDRDGWISKYQAAGELEWGFSLGAEQSDGIDSVAVAENDGFIIAGWFADAVLFGEGGPNEVELVASPGGADVFLARYAP